MISDDKLPLVKQVLLRTLDILDPSDTISIVTYAGSTGVALVPTPVSQRSKIEGVINSFSAGGGTAGGAGLDLAYGQAQDAFLEGGINHVLLCSDGDFNVGPSSTEELVELVEEKRESGITLTVLGFGVGNLNDAMMEMISNKGNGIYGVISSEESAARYVEERMLSSFNLVAKDVKLQVEFNPEYVLAYRLLGYENRAINDDDFRDDGIDAGEIGAGHQVTALYELVLTGKQTSRRLRPSARSWLPMPRPTHTGKSLQSTSRWRRIYSPPSKGWQALRRAASGPCCALPMRPTNAAASSCRFMRLPADSCDERDRLSLPSARSSV